MIEKFPYISPETAHALLSRVPELQPAKRGVDRRAYLFEDYAVLSSSRMKVRNVVFPDDDLAYLDDVIQRLARLLDEGVHVVPILGYVCDTKSREGTGYLIEPRARGEELYDDAVICKYLFWTQRCDNVYLKSDADPVAYILSRTHAISAIPQAHFDQLVHDIRAILQQDLVIDFLGKSNFFYDEQYGFSFIDLDCHMDHIYDPTAEPLPVDEITAMGAFVPFHFASSTRVFAGSSLVESAIQEIGTAGLRQLAEDNLRIFEKCRAALYHNDIPEDVIRSVLQDVRVYGQPDT